MWSPRLVRSFLVGAIFAATISVALADQSICTSRQFIVYGPDLAMRGAMCDFAERTKRELLAVLDQRDDWKTAILINARYRQANLPELRQSEVAVGQTGFGLKLQVDLVVDSGVGRPEIRRELLRALLLELMYRGQPNLKAGAAYASPPDWLLDGIPAEEPELSRDRLARLLALPVAAKSILPLEKLLGQRPELLDAAGRTLHCAYSLALVDLICHAPGGSRSLARFITDLPASSNDSMAELRRHFPGVFEDAAVAEENWEKQVARLASQQPYQLLGSAETERLLAKKLRLRISERGVAKWCELEEFRVLLKSSSAQSALNELANELRVLGARANPIYSPIIVEYADITAHLLRGKTGGIAKRLEQLRTARKTLTSQTRQIDDYLNWFEATGLDRPSGEFADYMRAAERAAQPDRTKRDAISVYLDVLETEFEN